MAVLSKVGTSFDVNTDGGYQSESRSAPTCDTGASVFDPPSVVSDGNGNLDIRACFGQISLSITMCSVDPCTLQDRVAALEAELAALSELDE